MDAREKIINAIEKAKRQSEKYEQDRIIVPFKEADMIIALLKEQEAKQTPKDIKSYYGLVGGPHGACPSCCTTIPRILGQETRFCPFCGQAVKWNE